MVLRLTFAQTLKQKLLTGAVILLSLSLVTCSDEDSENPIIRNVTFSSLTPSSHSTLLIGKSITVNFSYNINVTAGVRVIVRPLTGSSVTPNSTATPAPLYSGTGNGSAAFTVSSGNNVHIDKVQLQVWNADQTEMFEEQSIEVDYTFMEGFVELTEMSPGSGSKIVMGQNAFVKFKYFSAVAEGIRVFIRPITLGALTPNYSAHSSPDYLSQDGQDTGYFTINDLIKQHVDQIRVQAIKVGSDEVIFEKLVAVDLDFVVAVATITRFVNGTSGQFCAGEYVTFDFDYKTATASGLRIFLRPMTNGKLSELYGAHGSPAYSGASGSGSGYFTIFANDTIHVDHARIQVYDDSQSTLLFEDLIPVDYTFYSSRAVITKLTPASPTTLTLNSTVTVTFDYTICEAAGARIFIRPFTGGALSPSYAASPSPLFYDAGSSTATFSIGGNVTVDKLRIQVFDANQTILLYEYFENVSYTFKN
jgi:hypothetical protein